MNLRISENMELPENYFTEDDLTILRTDFSNIEAIVSHDVSKKLGILVQRVYSLFNSYSKILVHRFSKFILSWVNITI